VIRSAATICYEILDEVRKVAAEVDGPGVQVRVNPDIARALREDEWAVLAEMQTAVGKRVSIRSDPHLHHEQFDVMVL
jgi:ribonuclease G